jgi:hypothetical protein
LLAVIEAMSAGEAENPKKITKEYAVCVVLDPHD